MVERGLLSCVKGGVGCWSFRCGGVPPPLFSFFWFLSQNWVTFFDFSLKLHCYIAYKLVCVRIIRVRKGGKC